MEYKEIVAVTGLGGLFQLLSTKTDGAILRSLEDQSTKFVSARLHNFTPLESIEVFTTGENTTLSEVFKAMKAASGSLTLPDAKADGAGLRAYFSKACPDLDLERVYASDMKKMIRWYQLLDRHDLLTFEQAAAAAEPAEAPQAEAQPAEPVTAAAEPAKTRKKATRSPKKTAES